MNRSSTVILAAALTLGVLVLALGCGSSGQKDVDIGRMFGEKRGFRVVNLTNIPLTVNYDERVIASKFEYGKTLGFMLARPGAQKVEASLEEGPSHVDSIEIPKGETKTLFATWRNGKPGFVVMGGDERVGKADTAAVRVLNMSEGETLSRLKVEGLAETKPVPGSFAGEEASASFALKPGNYTISGFVGGREIKSDTFSIDAGSSYSLVLARDRPGAPSNWVFLNNTPKMEFSVAGASPTG